MAVISAEASLKSFRFSTPGRDRRISVALRPPYRGCGRRNRGPWSSPNRRGPSPRFSGVGYACCASAVSAAAGRTPAARITLIFIVLVRVPAIDSPRAPQTKVARLSVRDRFHAPQVRTGGDPQLLRLERRAKRILGYAHMSGPLYEVYLKIGGWMVWRGHQMRPTEALGFFCQHFVMTVPMMMGVSRLRGAFRSVHRQNARKRNREANRQAIPQLHLAPRRLTWWPRGRPLSPC